MKDSSLVKDFQKVDFEGVKIDIPCGWKELLIKRYGPDFLEMSGNGEVVKTRHGFYSVDVPYDVYKKCFSKTGHNSRDGHKFILVGDNAGISEFYKSFGECQKPSALVLTHYIDWSLPKAFSSIP